MAKVLYLAKNCSIVVIWIAKLRPVQQIVARAIIKFPYLNIELYRILF